MTAHEQFEQELTRYAMGELEGAERASVEEHLEECAACRRELEEIRGEMALLALEAGGPAPPQRSRERLMAAIAREPRMRPVERRRPVWRWVQVAAMIVVVALLGWSWQQKRQLAREVATLQSELGASREESQRIAADYQHVKDVLDMFQSPKLMKVTLVPGQAKPAPHGRAIYDASSGHLIFLASNMPPAPPAKGYELWLIPKNGHAPMPAGMFWPDASGSAMVMLPPLPAGVEAKAFGVTVEPDKGSPWPTTAILMAGGE